MARPGQAGLPVGCLNSRPRPVVAHCKSDRQEPESRQRLQRRGGKYVKTRHGQKVRGEIV